MLFSCIALPTQNLGTDWDERVLPSIGNEIVKAVVAQYNAEQLLTQRDKVSRAVRCFPPLIPCRLRCWTWDVLAHARAESECVSAGAR